MAKDSMDRKPPYIPLTTLTGFIGKLKTTGAIPSRIDRSVLPTMSGDAQTLLRAGMGFLGLTEGDDYRVTARLRELVAAHGTDSWKEVFSKIVLESYGTIIGGVDLDNDTLGALVERFGNPGGLSGSSRVKAIRFFLAALDEIGVSYSPHFKAKGATAASAPKSTGTNGTGRRKKPKGSPPQASRPDEGDTPPAAGLRKISIALPTREVVITMPTDLEADELDFVMKQLKAFLELSKKRAQKASDT
jgi:hypothetical protein